MGSTTASSIQRMNILCRFDCQYCGHRNYAELTIQAEGRDTKSGTWHRRKTIDQMKDTARKRAHDALNSYFYSLGSDQKTFLSKNFKGRAVCGQCQKEQSFTRYNKLLRRINAGLVLVSLLLAYIFLHSTGLEVLYGFAGAFLISLFIKAVFKSRLASDNGVRTDKGPWFFDSVEGALQRLEREKKAKATL